MNPLHLINWVANPLHDIKTSIENLMDKYMETQTTDTETNKNPYKKLEEKFEPAQINM
jgi:hypothetical protein